MRTKKAMILRDVSGPGHPAQRKLSPSLTPRFSLAATLLLSLLAVLAGAITAAPTAAHPRPSSNNALTIVVPKPSNGAASGPAGTNVSITGSGASNSTYQLGYASKSDGCASGFQQLQSSQVTTKGDGSFSATFAWPDSTNTGSSYYVCAQSNVALPSPLATPLQSSQVFTVLGQDAPNIDLDLAPVSGTPDASATPPPSGSFYAGSSVQITGANFLPGGTSLQAFVTTSQGFSANDTQTYQPLALGNGSSTFSSHGNGAFSVTATMPLFPRGQVFLHVVSSDASGNFPPSLVATQAVTVLNPQPTPTPPTPSPSTTTTTTPSVTPTGGSTGTTGNTPDPGNVLAVIGLSGLSIILFIVGIILMTSASAMAGNRPR